MEKYKDMEYAGFWIRFASFLIDSFLLLLIAVPPLTMLYGSDYWFAEDSASFSELFINSLFPIKNHGIWDVLLSYVFPIIIVIVFWYYKSATPGKMAFKMSIVDASTGNKPTIKQYIIRYVGYYVSLLFLCLGYFWIAFDKKNQGWHDKLANTVVIRNKTKQVVSFDGNDEAAI